MTQGSAQALFDGAVLPLHGAADAPKLGRGVVVEAAVGLDLAAQQAQQRGEVVVQQRRGELGDARPFISGGSWAAG